MSTFLPANSSAIALSFLLTFFFLRHLVSAQLHAVLPIGDSSPHLLARHDERATDVSVFDETFTVRQMKLLREIKCGHTGGVRNWDDHIDSHVLIGQHAANLLCQQITHGHPTPVHANAVKNRIWPCEIDIFEDVWCERYRFGALSSRNASAGDDDRLSRLDILPVCESCSICNDALARKQMVLSTGWRSPDSHTDGSNAVRVAERDDAEASEHGHACIGTFALTQNTLDCSKDIVLVDAELSCLLEMVGKDVEQQLRVAVSVDVPMRLGIKLLL